MSAAAVIDHIRNKGLRGMKRDRRALGGSCVTEISALNFKSSLRTDVKRYFVFCHITCFLFSSVSRKAYIYLMRLFVHPLLCSLFPSSYIHSCVLSLFMLKTSHLIM